MADIRDGFIGTVGRTPLIRLQAASERTGCEILGKAEFLNPGGSVKDRAALGIVEDGERRGLIRPGGVIVEGTAGNTGIGLALVGNTRGYRTIIVMPETQSREKIDALRFCGPEVRLIPAVPYKNPNHFIHTSRRLAEELAETEPEGVLWANQFDNTANRDFHEATTGAEILEQTAGRIDGFVCSAGTGGTITGVGRALKKHNADVTIGIADPTGSVLCSWITRGELVSQGGSISEGIGNSRVTDNLRDAPVDTAWSIPDSESVPLVFELIEREGLVLGGSSGVNLAGAIRLAEEMGPGHTIVTVLADGGMRYRSRLFNPSFLREKNLPVPDWMDAIA